MEPGREDSGRLWWADMLPEVLAKVFSVLPLHDLLHSVPLVCSAWHRASLESACWTHVDLSLWSRGKSTEAYYKMLSHVIERSQGGLKQLVAPNLIRDSMLHIISQSGQTLQALQIPHNSLSEECFCRLAPTFVSLTCLDIRGMSFTSRAIVELFGKHCPSIKRLALDTIERRGEVSVAFVAQSMPGLTHLELGGSVSDTGLTVLLEKCTYLEHLDLRGCWGVALQESTLLEARKKLKVFYSLTVDNKVYRRLTDPP